MCIKIKMIKTLIIVIAILSSFYLGLIALDRQEVKECNNWKKLEMNYPLYNADKWQIEQCYAHGIELIK